MDRITAEQQSVYLELAVAVAKEAGELIKERFGRDVQYELKSSPHDLVTEADRLVEEAIIERIRTTYPEHDIVSEECAPERSHSSRRWVIDPIDGTTNYAHGIPFFSISIAFEKDERLISGVVYDPTRDELFSAQIGQGARLNGQPIEISPAQELKRGLIATGFPYVPELRDLNLKYFEALLPATQGLRRLGSAALSLAYVACGRLDGYWDLDLNRWDLAAGVLLVQEAGGRVSDLSGDDLPYDHREIVASNGRIHGEMIEIFKSEME